VKNAAVSLVRFVVFAITV